VAIFSPEQSQERGYTSGWQVCWEAGPYMWAVGCSLTGLTRAKDFSWFTETYWGFDLCFAE
jgi:hypothetical protein